KGPPCSTARLWPGRPSGYWCGTIAPMTESVPLVLVGVLVSFGILRVVLPRRATVLRRPAGAFELRRPLSRRLFELSRLAFWTVLLMIFFVAAWLTDFVL